ncbi:hypothetical protein ACPA0F_18180 [Solibacillus silvestris]
MYSTSVSYLVKAIDPYTSNNVIPIKYFNIPLVVANYPIRYSPVSMHPSLLMLDYLVTTKDSKLSKAAEDELILSVRKEFEAEEFVVVEGVRTSEEGYVHSLVTFNRPNEKNAVTGQFDSYGERDISKDLDVLQKFHKAWRTSKKMTVQQAGQFDRDKEHNLSVQQSISFLRDRVKDLGINLPQFAVRDMEQETVSRYFEYGLRDYVHKAEIGHTLGLERDNSHGMVKVSTESALRDYQHGLSVSGNFMAKREFVKDLQVSHSLALAERPKIFDMVRQFLITGERPIQREGQVTWEHIAAERIIDADATIQQTLLLAERVRLKGGAIHGQLSAEMKNLRKTIISFGLDAGKLKARQYPSHITFDLLKSDRVINKATHLLKNSQFTRDITDKMALQHLSKAIRLSQRDLTLQQSIKSVRHKTTDMIIKHNLIESKRDKVSEFHLHNLLIESVRDMVHDLTVKQVLGKAYRDHAKDGSIVYGNLKQAERHNTHDLNVPFSLDSSSRVLDDNLLHLTKDIISSERIFTSDFSVKFGSLKFNRDDSSELYLPKQDAPTAERDKTSSLHLNEGESGEKEVSRPLHIHTFTPAEREHVKDLLLSFIGDYVRKNYHDMSGPQPNETGGGGTLPSNTLDGYLMEDEIVAELVDDFATLVESLYLGEANRPLEGSLLTDKMLATREKIEGFLNQGVLQGSAENNGGVVLFNTNNLMGSTEKSGIYSEGQAGERQDPEGTIGESLLGKRPDVYGTVGVTELASRPDVGGVNLEKQLTGSYGREATQGEHLNASYGHNATQGEQFTGEYNKHTASEDEEFAFGYINASPADFLSAEELAKLQSREGLVSEEISMGQATSRMGQTGYVEFLGENLNFEKSAFLEQGGRVELMGLRPISEGHLKDEIILGRITKLELHGVIHESIEGTLLNNRQGQLYDEEFTADKSYKEAINQVEEWLTAVRNSFGKIEDELNAGKLEIRNGVVQNTSYLFDKDVRPIELLDTVETIKEKVTFLDKSHYFSNILKDSFLEADIHAVKEKTFHLHDLLYGVVEKDTVLENVLLFDKELDGTIEGAIFGSNFNKIAFVEEDIAAGRYGKEGYVESDLLAGRFGKVADTDTMTDNMLFGETVHFGTFLDNGLVGSTDRFAVIQTEFIVGERPQPLPGIVLNDSPIGGRVNLKDGMLSDLYWMGTRPKPFGFTLTENVLGELVTDRPGLIAYDNYTGQRILQFGHIESLTYEGHVESRLGQVDVDEVLGTVIDRQGLVEEGNLQSNKIVDSFIDKHNLIANQWEKRSILSTSEMLFKTNGKNGSFEHSLLAKTNGKNSVIENTILAKTNGKNGAVGTLLLSDKESHGTIETVVDFIKEKLSYIEKELIGRGPDRKGYVEHEQLTGNVENLEGQMPKETFLGTVPKKEGVNLDEGYQGHLPDQDGIVLDGVLNAGKPDIGGIVEHSYSGAKTNIYGQTDNSTHLGTRPDIVPAVLVEDTAEGNVLQRYGVTEEHLIEAEKLKWVGILTNLLFADEEKGHSYVDYLMDAGVIKNDHFHLLNGLVGDLVQRKGMAFGEEFVGDLTQRKADLIENLQGQGLIYEYEDANTVLEKGMEIEDWDLDLGYGLPENYDPYDPFNSFYPYLLDNYDVSTLSLQQLEQWKTFGGNNWQLDNKHGQITSVKDNENPNGYVLNRYDSANYKFSVNFKVTQEATDQDGVGVVFKYTNEQNYYKFVITGGPANSIRMGETYMQLYRVRNGAQQPLGSAMSPTPWVKGEWYNIRVHYVNKHIQIWVNDRLQYDMIDY